MSNDELAFLSVREAGRLFLAQRHWLDAELTRLEAYADLRPTPVPRDPPCLPIGAISVDASQIIGSTTTIDNFGGIAVRVGGSLLNSGNVSGTGMTCVHSYDEDDALLGTNCT